MNELRFDVFGFSVNVQPAFAILIGIYALFMLQAREPLWAIAAFGAIVFASILLHELGHALMARRLGMRVGGIYIHGFGGHVTHSGGPARHQLWVSLAGPGAGLAIGVPLLLWRIFGDVSGAVATVLDQAVFVNVWWSIFNLFPMLPLDGGKAFGSFLELVLGPARGWSLATGVGMVTGAGLAVLGLYIDWIFLMMIGGYCAWTSYQANAALRAA